MDWMTIDFEASCLPRHGRSFPIEVAVSGPTGTFSWLIRPHPAWRDWDWTEEAFRLHGIRRGDLDRHGLAPHQVMANLQRVVGSARLVADSGIDSQWLQILTAVVNSAAAPPLRIDHVSDVFDEIGATHEQIMAAQQHADDLCPDRHRAGADALWLHTLVDMLLSRSSALPPPQPWRVESGRHRASPPASCHAAA